MLDFHVSTLKLQIIVKRAVKFDKFDKSSKVDSQIWQTLARLILLICVLVFEIRNVVEKYFL